MTAAPRPLVLCASLALALCTFAAPLRADNPPKFKDADVTAYFQKMSDITDNLLAAVKAKDDAKSKEWTSKLIETAKTGDALKSKVSPEEDEIASKWGETQMQKLIDAGWTASP